MKQNKNKTPTEMVWHQMSLQDVLLALDTDGENGLASAEALRRREVTGPNLLIEKRGRGLLSIFLEQIRSLMVVVLLAAGAVSLFLGEFSDVVAILAIVLLNAVLGVKEEYKAEKAIAALRRLAVPRVKVLREGQVEEAGARDLVPGDIVLLEAGDMVPADCRLLSCETLRIQESSLTGESEPVEKWNKALAEQDAVPLGDRVNMAFMGTPVVHGHGKGVVTGTGMNTEIGRVAGMIQDQEEEATPLQKRLDRLARNLAFAALALVLLVVLLGLVRGEAPKLLFLTAVSLAVAVMPEGLPAVVTIALALGAERMLRYKALIRRLPAVESLGSVTVICTDKTGTLTENTMTVTILDAAGRRLDLAQKALKTGLRTTPGEELVDLSGYPAMTLLLAGGALCNDATLRERPDKTLSAVGDPTEGALVVAAARAGLGKSQLDQLMPRLEEVPFDSDRRLMTTVHSLDQARSGGPGALPDVLKDAISDQDKRLVITKGAIESLLPLCDRIMDSKGPGTLTAAGRDTILKSHDELAGMGMRILGVSFRGDSGALEPDQGSGYEKELVYVGMVGILDPPRPEALKAVQTCRAAGIRTIMITGDHPLTAAHIAGILGIGNGAGVLTGAQMDQIPADRLAREIEGTDVYARVSPAHKLRIVKALRSGGHIVAMTGDGVNDAPALKSADVGVAMGLVGTEVAKEAADIVLQDDNFATIVHAVREGRIIFDNIRKFVLFILASNSAEILVMLAGPLMGMPLPLYPLQILWVNLLSDGLPAVALAVEPGEKDVMERAPIDPKEGIFTRGMVFRIVWVGTLLGALCLFSGYRFWSMDDPAWRTLIFSTLTFGQMANVLAVRTGKQSLFRTGIMSNRPLLGAVLLTCALQVAVIYLPPLQSVFKTVPLTAAQFGTCLFLSFLLFWAIEGEKLLRRLSQRKVASASNR
ncbi:MAG: cation-translocating P-type ATPase [bacterium]|nr:cation-translocating P-type ATPase [bacterium]MDT8366563.1 cation-translocating P-type ATPase [bacterium]